MAKLKKEIRLGKGRREKSKRSRNSASVLLVVCLGFVFSELQHRVAEANDDDISKYGYLTGSSYLNDGSSLYLKIDGCAWGIATYTGGSGDSDLGCMENDSEDGTTSWYMMSNCRRAQVAYSLYSNNGCGSSNRKGSFVTKDGVAAFAEILAGYSNAFGNDDENDDMELDNFPVCEQLDGDDDAGTYYSVGCNEDGSFTIATFSDAYCLQFIETIDIRDDDYYYDDDNEYSFINQLNNKLMGVGCTDSSDFAGYLVPYSEPCTSLDSSMCSDNDFQTSDSLLSKTESLFTNSPIAMTWSNKLKYVLGASLLLASAIMFLGILFMNRRRRRAMMHRKYRSSSRNRERGDDSRSRKKRSSSRRGGRSESGRSSRRSKSRTRSRSRSKSKARESSEPKKEESDGGVFA